jgi:hypothetical protein
VHRFRIGGKVRLVVSNAIQAFAVGVSAGKRIFHGEVKCAMVRLVVQKQPIPSLPLFPRGSW